MDQQDYLYSNPEDITSIHTLEHLIRRLYQVFESDYINIEYVTRLMEAYKSNTEDWGKFAKFDQFRYTKNLIDEGNGKFDLILVCWKGGQKSPIHDHADSHCFMKTLAGTLTEIRYDWPKDNTDPQALDETSQTNLEHNEVCYMSDALGLHSMGIADNVDTAVSLHLYSPPISSCQVFDPRTGNASKCRVTFWSKFGERTPFSATGSSVPTENNEIIAK
ncbi:unnamed protein product [Allacma fusca]|uniref:Cysteine dioxygenase n=1 Tax=Allacma fusca TaxID=39272 RepID=A0A8J2PLE8_9HEXA|nr:unnamed protein product [Allacma fusca]